MTTKPTGVWLREGDLVYRLAETPHGVSNCDEIKVSQADGRRLSAVCHERAEDLLVALQAVERAKAWQPPHDGIRAALAAVPADGEWRGFAAECALQYGAEYLDDDAELVVMTEENLVNMMAALGYPTRPSASQPPARPGPSVMHELKIAPEYYDQQDDGSKTFELRRDDRDYRVGDVLLLREYDGGGYTGRAMRRDVVGILRGPLLGLAAGWVIMSTQPVEDYPL